MSGNYLKANLSGLISVYGWEKVQETIKEILRGELNATKRCLVTGKPLAHPHICDYCRANCPLAEG